MRKLVEHRVGSMIVSWRLKASTLAYMFLHASSILGDETGDADRVRAVHGPHMLVEITPLKMRRVAHGALKLAVAQVDAVHMAPDRVLRFEDCRTDRAGELEWLHMRAQHVILHL